MSGTRATKESLRTTFMRWSYNWLPAYRGTGGRITFIASDFREVRIRLPLSIGTRNVLGTIFGGSLYGCVDPVYAVMLMHVLGPGHVAWDKSATIRFLKPGRETLYATFVLEDDDLAAIRAALDADGRCERTYTVELANAAGVVHARFEKLLSIRRAGASRG